MTGSVNVAYIVGNLTRDVEVRSTQNGDRIANLSVATNETWKDRSGERKERAEFHRVVIWNPHLVEIAEKYLRKGSKVYLSGSLSTRKWQDQQGNDRYSTEIVLTRFKGELVLLDGAPREQSVSGSRPDRGSSHDPDLDSEIPFITASLAHEPYLRKWHKAIV